MRPSLRLLIGLTLIACAAPSEPVPSPDPPRVSHGPLIGDVTASSAIVWARGNRVGRLRAQLLDARGATVTTASARVFRVEDYTGKIRLAGLWPSTEYRLRVSLLAPSEGGEVEGPAVEGRFRTAPPPDEAAALRLAFGGDLAGQNVCRDVEEGFPVFESLSRWKPDLFIGLGDMIYADGVCVTNGRYGNRQVHGDFGPSTGLEGFWSHWRYSREDPGLQRFLAETPYVAIWDDHEVVNDFGPGADTRDEAPYEAGVSLLPLGLTAFLDYNPVAEEGVEAGRLHRRLRWGRHLEIFVLDTRQYRDAAARPDDPAAPKSLLGPEQRAWLEAGLVESDATWKLVVSSVPLSIPTGAPERRDGWANFREPGGYEGELLGILGRLREAGVANTLWITTDVHFAAAFRYTPFAGSPDFQLHEIVTGPLNAGLFGHERFDDTLGTERLFYFGPQDFRTVQSWEEARRWFNFGVLDVDAEGSLTARIVDVDGRAVFELPLGR